MMNFIVVSAPHTGKPVAERAKYQPVEFDQGIKGTPVQDKDGKTTYEGKIERKVFDYIDMDDDAKIPEGCIYAARWDGRSKEVDILVPLAEVYERQHVFAGWPL